MADIDRINEIKDEFHLNFLNNDMEIALQWARKQIKETAYQEDKRFYHTDGNNQILIDNHVANQRFDFDPDYDLTQADIEILESQHSFPYATTDLQANISSVVFDHPMGKTIITMDQKYPTSTYKLQVTYYRLLEEWSKAVDTVKRIESLYVVYYLFENLDVYKLQRGITTRSINGINIAYDKQSMDIFKTQLYNQIYNEIMLIKPFELENITINKGY